MRECQSAGFSTHSCQKAPMANWLMGVCRTETRQEQIRRAVSLPPLRFQAPRVSAAAEGRCPPSWGLPMSPLSSVQLSCTLRPNLSLLAPVGFSQALSVISKFYFFFVGIFYTEQISNQRERTFFPLLFPLKGRGSKTF